MTFNCKLLLFITLSILACYVAQGEEVSARSSEKQQFVITFSKVSGDTIEQLLAKTKGQIKADDVLGQAPGRSNTLIVWITPGKAEFLRPGRNYFNLPIQTILPYTEAEEHEAQESSEGDEVEALSVSARQVEKQKFVVTYKVSTGTTVDELIAASKSQIKAEDVIGQVPDRPNTLIVLLTPGKANFLRPGRNFFNLPIVSIVAYTEAEEGEEVEALSVSARQATNEKKKFVITFTVPTGNTVAQLVAATKGQIKAEEVVGQAPGRPNTLIVLITPGKAEFLRPGRNFFSLPIVSILAYTETAAAFAPQEPVERVKQELSAYVVELSKDFEKAEETLKSIFLAGREWIQAEEGKFVVELRDWEAKLIETFKIGTTKKVL